MIIVRGRGDGVINDPAKTVTPVINDCANIKFV